MRGCYLVHTTQNLVEAQRRQILSAVKGIAVGLSTGAHVSLATTRTIGCVALGDRSRSTGISAEGSFGERLMLLGAAWRPDRPDKFCDPDEALDWTLSRTWQDGSTLLGHYLLILIKPRDNSITIENDPFGLLPFYYGSFKDGLIAASELKIPCAWSAKEYDPLSISEHSRFGYLVSDRTFYKDVRRLPPNSRLTWSAGKLTVDALSRQQFSRDSPVDGESIERLDESFQSYLTRLTRQSPAASISLSGGLDSRMVADAAQRAGLELTAFTSGVPNSLECRVASEFAKHADIPIVSHEFDGKGMASWFTEATWITEGRCPPGHMHFLDAMMTGHRVNGPQLHGLIGDAVVGGDLDLPLQPSGRSNIESACQSSISSILYWPGDSYETTWNQDVVALADTADERVSKYIFDQIRFSGTYSDYLWFRYYFRVFGFTIPCLGSQVLPWSDMYAPFLDPEFFKLSASFLLADVLDRNTQIRWARSHHPATTQIPRVKDGVVLSLSDSNRYQTEIQKLQRKQRWRYLLCRATLGRVNLPSPESYPNYDQWYRKWPSVRSFVDDALLGDSHADLWRRSGVVRLLRDLKVGRNTWASVGSVLQIATLLPRLDAQVLPPEVRNIVGTT